MSTWPVGQFSAHFLQPWQNSSLNANLSPGLAGLITALSWQYFQQFSHPMQAPQDMQRFASARAWASVIVPTTSTSLGPDSRSAAGTTGAAQRAAGSYQSSMIRSFATTGGSAGLAAASPRR